MPTKNLVIFSLLFLAVNAVFGHTPSSIRFIENKNQWPSNVLYKAEIPSGALYLENNCFTYSLMDKQNSHHPKSNRIAIDSSSIRVKGHSFKVHFENSNSDVALTNEGESEDYLNYYLGSDQSKWASNVKLFEAVTYQNLYNGIDLKVYSHGNNLKYDFNVLPRVDPSIIKFRYEGIDRMYVSQEGNLVLITSLGNIIEKKPYSYQKINGKTIAIPCDFKVSNATLSFHFPRGYNTNFPLTIDPVLIFSTYSGSTADNFGYTAAPDSKGFLYAGSTVFGNGYPITLGAYQLFYKGGSSHFINGGTDIGITKYDTSGTKRIYSTYLGGAGDDVPHSIIVNEFDELYLYGTTGSANFPITSNAYDNIFNGGTSIEMLGIEVNFDNGCDIFVSKLSEDGSTLLASTYLGGNANDGVLALENVSDLRYNYADELRGEIEIDKSNNIYIATCTQTKNFFNKGFPFQKNYGGGDLDGLIVKMDSDLSTIIWSSYLGGNLDDAAYSIELDSKNNLYVCGGTNSTDFPTTSSTLYPTAQGGRSDGFITYIDQSGSNIIYSSYFGSPVYDQAYFVGLDRFDNVHLFGQTRATGADTVRFIKNATYRRANSGQFISKLTPELNSIIWSTTFGNGSGKPNISPTAFLVDLCSKIYLSGWGGTPEDAATQNMLFNMDVNRGPNPISDFYQPNTDNFDFYLLVLEDDASALNYASFFGGNISVEHVDGGTSRFDRKGKIYQAMCAGCKSCTICPGNSDMPLKPTLGAAQLPSLNNSSNCNIGVFKMDFKLDAVVADFYAKNACAGDLVQFTNTSKYKPTTTFSWSFGDGGTSNALNPTHTYLSGGNYSVSLILTDNSTCNLADTIVKKIYISAIGSLSVDAIADDYEIYKGKSTIIRAIPPKGLYYSWTPSSTLNNPFISNPTATPLVTTTYTVAMYDPKVTRCSIIDSVTIKVVEIICDEPYIYIPNSFTPNEDSENDVLFVRSKNIKELYLAIYNRWGEKVFDTKDQTIGWDGTYKGMNVDPGVFDYYIEAICVDDQKFFKKGNITLIR